MADLSELTTRARRTLRRHRRWLAAVSAAVAVVAFARVVAPPPPTTDPVAVAARDLPAGHVLADDDLRLVEMPSDLTPRGASARTDPLLGRTLAAPVRLGETISDRRVVGAALVAGYADGLVAAPIRIDDPAVVGLLRVGDLIDVYVAVSDDVDDARLVVSEAAVVTLPEADDATRDGRLVVLAVQSSDAAALAQAAAQGPLSVSLRG